MRSRLLVVLCSCFVAAPGFAGIGATADYTGTISLQGLSNLTPIGSGVSTALVNTGAHLTQAQLPGGITSVMTTSSVTGTTLPFTGLIATVRDGSGTIVESGGVLQGQIPLTGNVRVCLFLACAVGLDVPLTQNGTRGVGLGGPPIVVDGGIVVITLQGASWQTGSVTAMTTTGTLSNTLTSVGSAMGIGGMASSTLIGSGMVQLVTPIQVTATAAGGSPVQLGFFGNYQIDFAPEPASGAMLVAGALALVALGRARRR